MSEGLRHEIEDGRLGRMWANVPCQAFIGHLTRTPVETPLHLTPRIVAPIRKQNGGWTPGVRRKCLCARVHMSNLTPGPVI